MGRNTVKVLLANAASAPGQRWLGAAAAKNGAPGP